MTLPTVDTARKLGLLTQEYDTILQLLGRQPNFTELAIYSAMWSEHCSYKNSIVWLKTLPRDSPRMLAKAGEENAGLVDIGDGLACSFKIESHNHPSAIEPYQGAATGVGGINRDIFTMGARPIALMNSLRFGNLALDRTKRLIKGVVKGIGDYGNAFGIPTVAGEVFFDESFNINILVNAFSAGIVRTDRVARAISYGAGNPVFIVGSATGKDGIHGASFASKDITESATEDLPAVQVGDPFQEKLLLEATLEVIEAGLVIGIQDMGAAGIICSTSEMSAKGKHGMDIQLDKVPTRQFNMQPFEILLSESQERMLIVAEAGKEAEIRRIFSKWELNCEQIGTVTESDQLRFYMHGELVAQVPAESLVLGGGAPVYHREYHEPAYMALNRAFNPSQVPDLELEELPAVASFLLAHPNIASKKWVYEQYDSTVGIANQGTNRPSDAGVVRILGSHKGLVMKVDCNSRYVYAHPQEGCAIAVAEAARNIVCSGGHPVAITNCLNFGNPYNPEVYWQFVESIKGMKKACEFFGTPVTGGNVSFYNQSEIAREVVPVFPTPTIGMIGLMEDLSLQMTMDFKEEGDQIYLLGIPSDDLASSEYLYSYKGIRHSLAPAFSLETEKLVQDTVLALIEGKHIASAHDCSDGGLFVALAESALAGDKGFDIQLPEGLRKDGFLFGEAQGRVVVTVSPADKEGFLALVEEKACPYSLLGEVKGESMAAAGVKLISLQQARVLYQESLGKQLA
jgi:phosphoribosylformylglycinamidine synthase II